MLFHRLLAVGLGVLAAVAGVAPAAAQTAAPAYTYVAVGDSVAAGVGAPPYLDPECLRSPNGYPALLAAARPGVASRSEACSGATTADVSGQLGSLSRRTRLVTVTVGGNDLEFSSRMATCMQGSDADCAAVNTAARAFATGELRARLDGVYRAIRQRAPRAEIVATGYARFFEPTADCAAVPPASLAKRTTLNETVDVLNRVIARQADRAGARFADVQPLFAGHGLCGADPWMTGLTDPAAFHPTAAGYRAGYLPALRRAADCSR